MASTAGSSRWSNFHQYVPLQHPAPTASIHQMAPTEVLRMGHARTGRAHEPNQPRLGSLACKVSTWCATNDLVRLRRSQRTAGAQNLLADIEGENLRLYNCNVVNCPPLALGCPMAAFSNWMDEIHSPPDFTTSLLLQQTTNQQRKRAHSIPTLATIDVHVPQPLGGHHHMLLAKQYPSKSAPSLWHMLHRARTLNPYMLG